MPNQILQENQIGKSDSTESTTEGRSKNFDILLGFVEYRNTEQRIQYENSTSETLSIKNYLCHQSDNKFIKMTEIKWRNQTLKIKDEYLLNQKQSKSEQADSQAKNFQAKRFNYSEPNNSERKDTKNLIKNIVNLFTKWLRIARPSNFEALEEDIKVIIEKNVYYNKFLISQISQQKNLCQAFIIFCGDDGQDLIQHSRINDKKCHIKALKNYQKYFQDKLKTVCYPENPDKNIKEEFS